VVNLKLRHLKKDIKPTQYSIPEKRRRIVERVKEKLDLNEIRKSISMGVRHGI